MRKTCNFIRVLALIASVLFIFSFSIANAQTQTSYLIIHALNPENIEIASIDGVNSWAVEIYDGNNFLGYSSYNQQTHNQPIAIAPGSHTIRALFNGMSSEKSIFLEPGQKKDIFFTFDNRSLFDLPAYINESNLSVSFQGSYSGITPRAEDWDRHSSTQWWVGGYFEESAPTGGGIYSASAKLQFSLSGTNYSWYNYAFYHLSVIHGRGEYPGPEWTIETSPDSGKYFIPSLSFGFTKWYVQYNYSGDVSFFLDNQQLNGRGTLLVDTDRDSTLQIILGNPLHVWGGNAYGYDERDYWHLTRTFEEGGSGILEVKMTSVPYDLAGTGIKDVIPSTSIDKTKQAPQKDTTSVGEPINVANGNMFTSSSDISIPSSLIPLELSRTYNSQDDFQGSFGYGWRSNFDITLTEQPDASVIEVDETGVYTIYTKNPDGTYSASAGKYSQLTKNPDNTYQILRKHGQKLYFNSSGLLTRIEDRNANAITILRSSSGVIQEVTDPSGRKLLFTTDSQGKITQLTDPKDRVFKYEYDSNGNLIKTIDSLNNQTLYQYDTNHNLIQKTDANNHSLYFEYDANDRAFHSWQDNSNNEVTLVFDPANKTTTSTDSLGNVTTYDYNDYGLVTKVTDAQGNTQTFNWDSQLNKTSSTNQNGSTTAFTYDSRGNLLNSTDALSNTTAFTYEPNFDFIASATDALGNRTEYSYDVKGNLIQTKDALNNITNFTYAAGLLSQILDANNNLTLFDYDSYANLVQITDTQNNRTLFSYDLLGNKTQTTDAQGNVTGFSYDSLNRLTQITYPDNSKVSYTYDPVGSLISSIDQNNNTTSYAYDAVDRLTQTTDAQGNTTAYAYDTEGNRTSITDAAGSTTQYFYDSLNRLIKTQDALNNQTLFSYDPLGNLTSKTDANGNTIYYIYDALNRLIEKGLSPHGTLPDSVVSYTYDAKGNMLTTANSNISYTFTYDSLGQLLSVTDSNNRTISYVYDAVGNKTQMTTPEAKTVSYTYDSLNRLASILDTYNKTTTYSYDSLSRRTKVTLPNQTQASYSYDSLNNLLNLANKAQSGKVISSYSYEYDKVGNRLTKTEPNLKTSYTYDALYRLTQSIPVKIKDNGEEKEKKNKLENYTYDNLGNRLTSKKDNYSYNSLNQLLSTKDYSYEYDKNGNLTKKTETDEKDAKQKNYTFTYDYENRLIKVEIQKENKLKAVTFTYDPFGRRISKTVQKEEIEDEDTGEDNDNDDSEEKTLPRATYYAYDSEDIILEYNQKAKVTARYTQGPGIDEPISIERNNKLYYYHYDGLGSVTALTNQKGKTAESYAYDSFGNFKRQGNKTKNRFPYTGREYDKETGLYYYRARYYDPKIGRFLQADPIGYAGGMNLYGYCSNNPINWVDPFGLDKQNNKGNFSKGHWQLPPDMTPKSPELEKKPEKPRFKDPTPKDPTPKGPTKGPALPDEFTRKARWWEWFIWVPWRFLYNYEVPPGYQGPDFGPVPPTHKDWPGSRKPRQEDFAI